MKPIILRNIIIIIFCLYLMTVSVSSAETKPVRIGTTVSLEGKYKEPSAMIQGGYKLWESQVNKRGGLLGRPVKLILYDDKSDEKLVSSFYEKLIKEDKRLYFIARHSHGDRAVQGRPYRKTDRTQPHPDSVAEWEKTYSYPTKMQTPPPEF